MTYPQVMVNNLYEYESGIIRIVLIDTNYETAYALDIHSPTAKFKPIQLDNLIQEINTGVAKQVIIDPWLIMRDDLDLSLSDITKRDAAWEVVKYIIDEYGESFIKDKRVRNNAINEASHKYALSRKTVIRYLVRFYQRGMIKNSLLPDYSNCGKKESTNIKTGVKLGRPRSDGKNIGINIDESIVKIFQKSLNQFYYNSNQLSLTNAYEMMIRKYFTDEQFDEVGVKKYVIKEEIPTMNQFRYWFNKEYNIKKAVTTRKGSKNYYLKNRPILGNSTVEAIGPGSIYQIDASIADVYLVSRYNRDHIIGRPVVYLIADVFSRCIVGLNVGLEGPSYIGALTALSNTASDKVKYCGEYDIHIEKEEWPINYIPDSIIADRGELEGFNIENAIESLNIRVNLTSSYRADLKSIVERNFKTMNGYVKPFVPGAIKEDFRKRGGKDYRLDAKLNILQFTQIIIRSVLYHNNHHILKSYKRDEAMIEDEVLAIPNEIWKWGIKNKAGKLREVDEDLVKFYLLPNDHARITEKGIHFKGMYYGSDLALKDRWFETARNRGSWKVKVSFDPRNMNYIYIGSKNGFEKCFLLDHEDRYKNKTLEEIEYLLKYEKMIIEVHKIDELQSKINLITEIDQVVKNSGKNKTYHEKEKLSDNKKLKNIRDNRAREKMLMRSEDYIELSKTPIKEGKVLNLSKDIEKDYDPDNEMIMKIQKEKLKNE